MSKAYAAWSLRRIQETGWEHIGNQGSPPCSNCQVILKKIRNKWESQEKNCEWDHQEIIVFRMQRSFDRVRIGFKKHITKMNF